MTNYFSFVGKCGRFGIWPFWMYTLCVIPYGMQAPVAVQVLLAQTAILLYLFYLYVSCLYCNA